MSGSGSGAISPLGVMVCALATLVAVPMLLVSGANGDGVEVAAVVVDDTVSLADLDQELELEELFEPGARVDDVRETPTLLPGLADAVDIVSQASGDGRAVGTSVDPQVDELQRSVIDQTVSGGESPPAAIVESPQGPAPTTEPPTTEPPTTEPPTTEPSTTEPPTTEPSTTVPLTTEPLTTEAPVVEAPQSPEPVEVAPPAQPTAEQWAALRHCEASGSYTIVSRDGRYHGAYQFHQPTWDGLARLAGRADLVGVPPSQAAPADQDAMALLLWQQRGNQPWPHCGRYLPPGP